VEEDLTLNPLQMGKPARPLAFFECNGGAYVHDDEEAAAVKL